LDFLVVMAAVTAAVPVSLPLAPLALALVQKVLLWLLSVCPLPLLVVDPVL
jgi:hypothetical protein